MSPKTRNIVGWILTSLIGLFFLWSAAMKFVGGAEMEKNIAGMGLTMDTLRILGAIEALSVLLFVIPRTGVVGTLLLVAYLGGAIATHLEHQQPVLMPVIFSIVIWITAAIRFPELVSRLSGRRAAL